MAVFEWETILAMASYSHSRKSGRLTCEFDGTFDALDDTGTTYVLTLASKLQYDQFQYEPRPERVERPHLSLRHPRKAADASIRLAIESWVVCPNTSFVFEWD